MKTILLVDDEARIRKIYRQFFSRKGFRVFEASDAVAANDFLVWENVDIMLLDINMPVVDGGTLYEVTKTFHKKTKVIVCSIYPIDDQEQIIIGAVDYYDKSLGLHELFKKVRAVL